MLCYAIVEIQWPLVIIFINVLHSLTTIGTGNLNCNKWHTELDQCEKCIFLFGNKIFLCYVWWWVMTLSGDIYLTSSWTVGIKMC